MLGVKRGSFYRSSGIILKATLEGEYQGPFSQVAQGRRVCPG